MGMSELARTGPRGEMNWSYTAGHRSPAMLRVAVEDLHNRLRGRFDFPVVVETDVPLTDSGSPRTVVELPCSAAAVLTDDVLAGLLLGVDSRVAQHPWPVTVRLTGDTGRAAVPTEPLVLRVLGLLHSDLDFELLGRDLIVYGVSQDERAKVQEIFDLDLIFVRRRTG